MALDVKHIATFLLGAAAGAAALKYSSMTDEEREELIQKLKEKAGKVKDEASNSFEKAQDYFSELGTKGSESLKEHWSGVEEYLKGLLGNKSAPDAGEATK